MESAENFCLSAVVRCLCLCWSWVCSLSWYVSIIVDIVCIVVIMSVEIESYMSDWRTYVISKYPFVYGLIHCVFVLNSLSGPTSVINIFTA